MKIIIPLFLVFIGFSHCVDAQSFPALTVPYIPIKKATPLDFSDIDARLAVQNQIQHDKAITDCQNQVVNLYKSAPAYPSIKDGKHLVTLIGPGVCREISLIVDKGRVFSMPKDEGGYITDFSISTPIKDGISKIGISNSQTGITEYLNVIFIKDIYEN